MRTLIYVGANDGNGLDNSFSKFKELLQERYEVLYYRSLKGKIIDKDDLEELSNHHEWDTYWKLK